MGDCTNVTLTIYTCPTDKVDDVLSIIENYELGLDWDWGLEAPVYDELILTHQYVAHEVSCGFTDEAGKALAAIDGVSFCVSEEGYGDWLGEAWTRLDLDGEIVDFRQDANNEQTPVWTSAEIYAAFNDGLLADEKSLRIFLGEDVNDKVTELVAAAEIEPARFETVRTFGNAELGIAPSTHQRMIQEPVLRTLARYDADREPA